MNGSLRKLILIVLYLFLAFLLLFSLWSFSFGCLAGVISAMLLCLGGWTGFRRKKTIFLLLSMLIWALFNLAFLEYSLDSYNRERDRYTATIGSGGELSFREKTNVYLLNVFMSSGCMLLYREIALESLLMMIPSGVGERRFQSSFFLKSEHIRQKIKHLKPGETVRVAWKVVDYLPGRPEARYALALNPCFITRVKDEGERKVYKARVEVEYPEKSKVKIIDYPADFIIEEGLFWYLQQRGWLHPYSAVWSGSME